MKLGGNDVNSKKSSKMHFVSFLPMKEEQWNVLVFKWNDDDDDYDFESWLPFAL